MGVERFRVSLAEQHSRGGLIAVPQGGNLRLLAVDLDGVLADTFWIHEAGWRSILALLGVDRIERSFTFLRGVRTREALKDLLEAYGLSVTEEELGELVRIKCAIRDFFLLRIDSSSVLPGVVRILRAAKQSGAIVACLATSTVAQTLVQRLGAESMIDELVCGESLTPPKRESAECLLGILESRGVAANQALFLDDDIRAVEAARGAGIPSLCVVNEEVEAAHPVRVSLSFGSATLADLWAWASGKLAEQGPH